MSTEAQLQSLQAVCAGAAIKQEANYMFVFLPSLQVQVGDQTKTMDALLSVQAHSGYTTRLFLAEQIVERPVNWSQHQILGRNWWTWSWQNVPETLPWIQILLSHLRALQ